MAGSPSLQKLIYSLLTLFFLLNITWGLSACLRLGSSLSSCLLSLLIPTVGALPANFDLVAQVCQSLIEGLEIQ